MRLPSLVTSTVPCVSLSCLRTCTFYNGEPLYKQREEGKKVRLWYEIGIAFTVGLLLLAKALGLLGTAVYGKLGEVVEYAYLAVAVGGWWIFCMLWDGESW